MRGMRLEAIALLLVGLGVASCGAERTAGPLRPDARLEVYVHWGDLLEIIDCLPCVAPGAAG